NWAPNLLAITRLRMELLQTLVSDCKLQSGTSIGRHSTDQPNFDAMVDLTSFGAKTGIFWLKSWHFGGRGMARLVCRQACPAGMKIIAAVFHANWIAKGMDYFTSNGSPPIFRPSRILCVRWSYIHLFRHRREMAS